MALENERQTTEMAGNGFARWKPELGGPYGRAHLSYRTGWNKYRADVLDC
jgi:hypothetical protein